LPYQ
ncbi:hypothetical protein EC960939_0718, partial [Escherichia coli 96.0939]